MNELVEMIRDKVIVSPRPAVYISGGIDSTIVLHHLREKYDGEIYTYHAVFGIFAEEREKAAKVAEHYRTRHVEVPIDYFVETLPEIMRIFDKPRYLVWPYWLARRAAEDGNETVYIGEGSDEHFGGYLNRGYLAAWTSQIEYAMHVYKVVHDYFGLKLEVPFYKLDRRKMDEFFCPPVKGKLREVYRDVLGEGISSIVRTQSVSFMAQVYWKLWDSGVSKCFSRSRPETTDELRSLLQLLVTKVWMDEHGGGVLI